MKIYDVTVAMSNDVPVYEGDPSVDISAANSIKNGDAANVSRLCCGIHTATHVDAPNHFIDGTRRVHELELEKLVGRCQVVEIDKSAAAVDVKHVKDLENVERILFKTGNSDFWNDYSTGFRRNFTYISPAAAQILVEKNVKLVGIDYLG